MHVLLVTNYFAPEGGAAAVRLTRLARQLQARGHRITVLTSMPHYPEGRIRKGYRGRLWVTSDLAGIRVVQTWLLATPSPRIGRRLVSQISFMLAASLRGLGMARPDVLLIEGQPIFAGLAGAFLGTVRRRPYVYNVSDLWPEHLLSVGALSERHPVYRFARRLVDAVYRRAAAIVAMSPRWAESITARVADPGKVVTILNGVDLDRFRPGLGATAFRRRHGLDGRRMVTFIGTFSTQYDFDAMLHVMAALRARPDVQVVFIGRGSQEERLRAFLAGTGTGGGWIPWIPPDEVPEAWAASYVTYWAIRDDPLYRGTIPAKTYEALACGVPVVAAMAGTGAELIEASGAGVVVPCGDAAGLLHGIGLNDDLVAFNLKRGRMPDAVPNR